MKQSLLLITVIGLALLTMGCSSSKKHHYADVTNPQTFIASFGDMDTNGDNIVNWQEFSTHFTNAVKKDFYSIDLNQDGAIDQSEWKKFTEWNKS